MAQIQYAVVHAVPTPTPRAMHGQFIWYELTTPDVGGALAFYPRFTGWGTQAFDKDYTMFTSGGTPVAGVFRLTDEMRQQGIPPNWMPYVEASNVDETAAKATSLGGTVVQGPADIPGAGRYAVVQDPQGAVFGIYKSSIGSAAWDGTAVVGRFSWHELMTADYAKAFEFYRALFGWEKSGEMDMGGGNMYFLFGKGDKMYGGMFNRPPEMAGMHPFWLVYVHVKDVGKAVASATQGGAAIQRPQMDIPGGSIAILGDPQGAGFAVHHVSAQPAATAATAAPAKSARQGAKKTARKAAKKAAKKTAGTSATKSVKKSAGKRAKKSAKKSGGGPAAKAARSKQSKTAATTKARRSAKRTATASRRPKAKRRAARKANPRTATRTKTKARGRGRARRTTR